jgi:zinc transporter ZupT
MSNFLDALLAVLAGNAIYFVLMPHLPRAIRHTLFKEDWGLLVDFAICAVIFVTVKILRRCE